jgi:arachidonate 15-lipoxygenase
MTNVNIPRSGQTDGKDYQYNYTYLEPIAMLDKLPPGENFADPWLVLTGIQAIKLAINTLLANRGVQGKEKAEREVWKFIGEVLAKTLAEKGESLSAGLRGALAPFLPKNSLAQATARGGETLEFPSIGGLTPEEVESALIDLLRSSPDDESALATSQQIVAFLTNSSPSPQPRGGQPEKAKKPDLGSLIVGNIVKMIGQDVIKTLAKYFFEGLSANAPTGRASSLEQYKKLFAYIDLPDIARTFQEDSFFAYTRVAGPNPVMIERMSALLPHFPVTEAQYQVRMGAEDSLETALVEGRLYIADYGVLDGATGGTFGPRPEMQKYVPAPIALFAVPPVGSVDRSLVPIAIQCGQSPDSYPVITPETGPDAWLMAKTVVQVADINFHEAVTHFARTHALMEPFAIATHRCFAATHPLSLLLLPHFQGTFAINAAAHESLIAPKGGVNGLLSPTVDTARVYMVKGLRIRGFNEDMFPKRLRERGVDDTTALPIYPYRDDGLLIWDAIHGWVAAYLGIYYTSDSAVQNDAAVQTWAREIVAFEGGRVPGFGEREDGSIDTLNYLIEGVTMIIFTASAQHAAVNFPQNSLVSFAPAIPTGAYLSPEAIGPYSTGEDWFQLLPPLDQAQAQLNLLYLLGSVYFTTLGQYPKGYFSDPKVAGPLGNFQRSLQDAEKQIKLRNQNQNTDYHFLLPSQIPQSINI